MQKQQAFLVNEVKLSRRTPPALRELLQAVMKVGGDVQRLAEHLGVSDAAIKNRARRLTILLDTHSLLDAVVYALNNGLVAPILGNIPPSDKQASRRKKDGKNKKT